MVSFGVLQIECDRRILNSVIHIYVYICALCIYSMYIFRKLDNNIYRLAIFFLEEGVESVKP